MIRKIEVYNVYRKFLDIIDKLSIYDESDIDKAFINVVRSTLIKLLVIAYEDNMKDLWIQINKVRHLLEGKIDETQYSVVIKCLLRCKDIIENFLDRRNVIIFTKSSINFKEIQELLERNGYNVLIEDEDDDIISTVKNINPGIIVIHGDERKNGVTLFKMLEDEGSIDNIPTLIVGPKNLEWKIDALSFGAIDYLYEEFDSNELFYKIRNIGNLEKRSYINSRYDTLTGVYSERYGRVLAIKEFKRVSTYGGKINIFIIDMDNMAEINMLKGNSLGNKIITKCIDIFNKYLKNVDFIYRKSSDKFVLIFLDTEASEVLKIGQKVQEEILKLGHNHGVTTSFSGGISFYTKDSNSFDIVYRQAYEKLKQAKISGKGKIYTKNEDITDFKKTSLLFVDDDKIIVSILSTRYKNKGYEIFNACSGEEALEIFANNTIDIIITDYFMPTMAGDELIKRIRRNDKIVKIIVLSAQKNEEFIKKALDLGADDYITKPFSPVELDLRIKKLLK